MAAFSLILAICLLFLLLLLFMVLGMEPSTSPKLDKALLLS
jgi:hypothetical protein